MEIFKQLISQIKQHQTIIIHRHIRPDGDCIGSQNGLKDIIQQTYPMKRVYAVGEMFEQLNSLGTMDTISDEAYEDALVIVVDVAIEARISDQRYKKAKTIVKIDHHPSEQKLFDFEWIDASYSSCCEMIVDFYQTHDTELKISKKGVYALYYGIVTDTNRFINPNISARTFKLASYLLDIGIDLPTLYRSIYHEPLSIIRVKGYMLSHLTLLESGLGYVYLDEDLCKTYQVDGKNLSLLANSLNAVEGMKIWFVGLYDKNYQKVLVSLRSQSLPINQIAMKFGGGGHKNASGFMLDDKDELKNVIQEIEKYIE